MSGVSVRIDGRMRLAAWLLAAGEWPAWEQARKPYRLHRVAEGTRRSLAVHGQHRAVLWAQSLAAQGEGGLSGLFGHSLTEAWPSEAAGHVAEFASAQPQAGWGPAGPDWDEAAADLQAVLDGARLDGFLADLWGGLPGALVVYPNLLYPGRVAVAARGSDELMLSQPPPPAWGASTPWHYDERPDEVLASLAEGFTRGLLAGAPALRQPAASALPVAAAVLFLRQAEGAAAAEQYMLMEKRARGLPWLTELVGVLDGCHGLAEVAEVLTKLETG